MGLGMSAQAGGAPRDGGPRNWAKSGSSDPRDGEKKRRPARWVGNDLCEGFARRPNWTGEVRAPTSRRRGTDRDQKLAEMCRLDAQTAFGPAGGGRAMRRILGLALVVGAAAVRLAAQTDFPDAHEAPPPGWTGPVFTLSQAYPAVRPPASGTTPRGFMRRPPGANSCTG